MQFPLNILIKVDTPLLEQQGLEHTVSNRSKNTLDFYHSIKPLCTMSRIFGLLPFTVHRDNGVYESKFTIFNKIWFVCTITTSFFLAFAMLPKIKYTIEVETSIMFATGQVMLLLNFMKINLAILFDVLNRKRLIKLWKKFVEFDKSVRKRLKYTILFIYFIFLIFDRLSKFK